MVKSSLGVKLTGKIVSASVLFLLLVATLNAQVRIMPLGDSITKGVDGPSTDDAGYRNDLAGLLDAAGFNYNFVGSMSDGIGNFDKDHEGHGGWRADQILAEINNFLNTSDPDAIILHIGTNDVSNDQTPQSTRAEVAGIIDAVDDFDPNIRIILCSVIPRTDGKDGANDQLNTFLEELFYTKRNAGINIYYAGLNEIFKQNPNWATDYFTAPDIVHPNDNGYALMGAVIFNAVMISQTVSDTEITDDFERASLGETWDADPEMVIINGDLSNTATTGAGNWQYMATYKNIENPTRVGVRWANDANATGINEGGLALLLNAPSQNADGFLAWITTGDNMLRVWTIENGQTQDDLNAEQPSALANPPGPGDLFEVESAIAGGNLTFTYYVNGQLAGSTTTPNPGLPASLYSGVILRHDRNNDISEFRVSKTSDIIPPAAASLNLGTPGTTSITLGWLATGDDGNSGSASGYDLRYSTSPINSGNFADAIQVSGLPVPGTSGTAQSFTVTGLQPGTTYYFALVVIDEAGNRSDLSNVISATTEAGNLVVDDFNRTTGLGPNWIAAAGYAIVNNQLSNTATDGNWDDLAVYAARKNPREMSYRIPDNADAGGIDQMGFALVFGSASATSSGYAITRRTAVNDVRLWTVVNGVISSVIDKNESPNLSPPVPGDVVKVSISRNGTNNIFDVYVNGQLDATVVDGAPLYDLEQDNWGGVTGRSGLNNDWDDFSMLLEIGDPASLVKVSGDAQADTVGQLLPQPIVVRVTDDNSSPIQGISVDFAVLTGGGSIDVSAPSDEIVVEAEAGSIGSPMVIGTDDNTSNGKFIYVPEGTGDDIIGVAEYVVTIKNSGTYVMWGRANTPDANADAFRVVVGGQSYLWDVGRRKGPSGWYWDRVSDRGNSGDARNPETNPVVFNFSAGRNTIVIQHAKDGAKLDQFLLTPSNSGYQPPANQDPVKPSGKITDGDGQTFVNWTLGPGLGDNSLRVSVQGLNDLLFTATGLADSVATITKTSGDNQEGPAGQQLPLPFEVELRDKFGNIAANAPVTFSILPPGNGSLSATNTTAGSNGRATSFLTLATNAPENQVSVTALGYRGPAVVFSALAEAGNAANIALQSGNNQTGSLGQPLPNPLRVLVTDANNRPKSGADVTFSVLSGGGSFSGSATRIATSNSQGIAEATPILGLAPAVTNTFRATASGLSGSPITFMAISLPPSTFAAISDLNQSGQTYAPLPDSIEVEVRDDLGAPIPNQDVAFAVSAGEGTVNGSSVTTTKTGSDGRARVQWRMGPQPGTHKLLASSLYGGSNLQGSPLEFMASVVRGAAENLTLISGNGQTGFVNQPLVNTFIVRVTAGNNDPVENWPVAFTVQSGGGTLNSTERLTDAQGFAQVRMTLGPSPGTNNNQVRVSAPQTSAVTFVASAKESPAANIALLSATNPSPAQAGTMIPNPVQALVTDGVGNPVLGVGVTFRIASGGGTINGTTGADTSVIVITDAQGTAQVNWYLGCDLSVNGQTIQIMASNSNGLLNGAPINITTTALMGPLDQDASTVEVDRKNVPADGRQVANIMVTLTDLCGNPITGRFVTLSSSRSDFINQPQAASDNRGRAFGSISSASQGKSTITASVDGGGVLNTSVIITFEDPNSVELSSFSARFMGFDGVKIHWVTSNEIGNTGFNILRSTREDGPFTAVNAELIKPEDDGEYSFADRSVESGVKYYYLLEDVDINGIRTENGPVIAETTAPELFQLSQNYPNPFNPETTIRFQLPEPGFVQLRIYDVLGRNVRTLFSGDKMAGYHSLTWDARDDNGQRVGSGVFYYQIVTATGHRDAKRMLLLK